jgi:aldehyde:ferredoxin oxidoreductase
LGGPDIVWDPDRDDDNPMRWYIPLPSGPYMWKAPTRAEIMEMRKKAYTEMGWDERGIPTTEKLTKLGLGEVDMAMRQLR